MALVNDSRLYSAGAVQFDARPHTALYANLKQREAARNEAMDEYMRNLNKSVNAAGMRNADRPIFDKKLADWQRFGIEHRDEIRNRKNGADIKFMQDYQDIQNLVSESKSEEEKKKPVVELMLDPNKRDRLNNDRFVEMIQSHDQPLYLESGERNPNRRSFDISAIEFDPKPFEQDKYFKQYEDIKRSDLPPTIVTDPKTLTQTVTTNAVYDPQAKDIIATRAVTDYMNNKAFKNTIDQLKPEDYNDFYKANYGHDIQNTGDLAVAYTLKGLQQQVTKTDVNPDTFERQKQMAAINDGYARARIRLTDRLAKSRDAMKKAQSAQDQDGVLNQYINQMYEAGTKMKVPTGNSSSVTINGENYKGKYVNVPKSVSKKYEKELANADGESIGKSEPDYWFMTEDKKVIPLWKSTEKTKSGNIKFVAGSKPIDVLTFKADLRPVLLGIKEAGSEVLDEFPDEEMDVEEEQTVMPSLGGGATSTKMVTMVLPDGRKGQIPEGQVSQFLKDNPKAKRQ